MAKRHKEPKEPRVGVRITDELRARLDAIHSIYGSSDTPVICALVEAWCEHVMREGRVRLPLRVEVDETRAEALVAEMEQGAPAKSVAAVAPQKVRRPGAA